MLRFATSVQGRFIATLLLVFVLCGAPLAAAETDPLLVVPVNSGACLQHLDRHHERSFLQEEVRQFQQLAEEALTLRAVTIKAGRELQHKAEIEEPLSGQDLDLLSQGLVIHLDLRKRLMAVAEAHECWLTLNDDELAMAGLTPESRLEGIMLSLAAALVMYDNYLLTFTLFEGDDKLRKLLNQGDQGYQVGKSELLKVSISYNSATKRARVRRAMRFYEAALANNETMRVNSYLDILINQSPSYDMVREWSPLHVIARKLGVLENLTSDSLVTLEHEGVSLFSMLFGNAVGLVETRKGKLFQRREVQTDLTTTLEPGDILLEKTPFRLTDKLIPGYWGHAAIWIGSEQELRDLGLWDHPLVRPHRQEIRQGRSVVEALRSGVEINPLESFLNIDSVGVLRRPGLSSDNRRQIILQALRQVGKDYDFSFDVESLDRVYCSKLIYLAYHGIDWSVHESFGRLTISPDDVAQGIFAENALELVSFYHDGRKVRERPAAQLASLMGLAGR